jgi:hypothetical protein
MSQPQSFRARWLKVSLPNKLTVLCTAIIAVATVWYAIVAHWQLLTMSEQLRHSAEMLAETKRSGPSTTHQIWQAIGNLNWNARASQEALNEARIINKNTGDRAQVALDASIAQNQLDQRAWVGFLESTDISFKANALGTLRPTRDRPLSIGLLTLVRHPRHTFTVGPTIPLLGADAVQSEIHQCKQYS